MLDSLTLLNTAALQFPRWFDVRKRLHTSDGGLFLRALITELDEIQLELSQYQAEHFLRYWIGKEDTVIASLNIVAAGTHDEQNPITMIQPALPIITDVREFYAARNTSVFWQDGYLMATDAAMNGAAQMKFSRGAAAYGMDTERQAIWNIFDEFALFSGLTRYSEESNADLAQRILLVYLRPANSSAPGLVNAIRNAAPEADILESEIDIKQVDQDVLTIPDAEFGTAYDRLLQINQDVLRTKVWDYSRWEHPFAKERLLPQPWDAALPAMQSGTGAGDDLRCDDLDGADVDVTDITVSAYDASTTDLFEHLRATPTEAEITLSLSRCENELVAQTAEYRIVAAEAKLVDETVALNCYRTKTGPGQYWLDDLLLDTAEAEAAKVPHGGLLPNTTYSLDLTGASDYADFSVTQCDLTQGQARASLLAPQAPFALTAEGALYHTGVLLHADSVQDFSSTSNLVDSSEGGFTIASGLNAGTAEFECGGMGGQYVRISHSCPYTLITGNRGFVSTSGRKLVDGEEVITNGFSLSSSGEWISDNDSESDKLVIAVTARNLTFKTTQGSCLVSTYVNNILQGSETWTEPRETTLSYETPVMLRVEILRLGLPTLAISQIKYNAYTITYRLDHGTMLQGIGGMILPDGFAANRLYIDIASQTGFCPVIDYVHIGTSLRNAVYSITFTTGADACRLDIAGSAVAKLTTGDAVSLNYSTKSEYANTGSLNLYLPINIGSFSEIWSTSAAIEPVLIQGSMVPCIVIEPGMSLDAVSINGIYTKLHSILPLKSRILGGATGLIYASRLSRGFVKSTDSAEELVVLERSSLPRSVDKFTVTGLAEGWSGVFVLDEDRNVEVVATTYDKQFAAFYLLPPGIEHVAYNRLTAVLPEQTGVAIVDLFSPALPHNRLMVWSVSSGSSVATVAFEKAGGNASWSLGRKTLQVTYQTMNDPRQRYVLTNFNWQKTFTLSSSVAIERNQTIGGQVIDLAQYQLTAPEGLSIAYKWVDHEEDIIIEEDGFNKLHYANIGSLSIPGVPGNNYALLGPEGILTWRNPDLYGTSVRLRYSYQVPEYLIFTDPSLLYEATGYEVSACKLRDGYPQKWTQVAKDTQLLIPGLETAVRVVVSCSRPNFSASYVGGKVLVKKTCSDNRLVNRSGWYYDAGNQYFHHHDYQEESVNQLQNVELDGVYRRVDGFVFRQKSSNYLPESDMKPRRLQESCIGDFLRDNLAVGVSTFSSLTACDNVNVWDTSAMTTELVSGINGLATRFVPEDDSAYALLKITPWIFPGVRLSLIASGLTVQLGREIRCGDLPYTRSVFVEPCETLTPVDGFYSRLFQNTDFDDSRHWYLIFTGSGTVDDIIAKLDGEANWQELHVKNVNRLNLAIEEAVRPGGYKKLPLGNTGLSFKQTELGLDGVLRTGASVDWGLTKVFDLKDDWSKASVVNAWLIKGRVLAADAGYVQTTGVQIPSAESIRSIVAKVNGLRSGKLSGITLSLYTSASAAGPWTLVNKQDTENQVSASGNLIAQYVKVRADMVTGQVIENIEVYVEYQESAQALRPTTYASGMTLLRVTDLGQVGNWRLRKLAWDKIDDAAHLSFSVRGLRINDSSEQWTEWKPAPVDDNGAVTELVEFRDYRYIQIRVEMSSSAAAVRLTESEWEVIS